MTRESISPQLCMRRNLQNVKPVELPDEYEMRCFRPGDVKAWNEIINISFDRTNMDFNKLMRPDYAYREERVLFVCYNGCPVATAGAWYKPEWGKDTGYLHMVGTHPDHAGKGLGLQVSLAAMHQMAAEGREDAVLQTDDFRIPALKTYLKLGFEPVVIHENQKERWMAIFKEISRPELIEKFKGSLEIEPIDEVPQRKNLDYEDRYPMAHRWHTDRPHRLGTAKTDALGDESLYKPSKLGFASVEPKKITAASNSSLIFTYTAGEESLPEGTIVTFYTDGQGTLFKNPRLKAENDEPLTVETTGDCIIKPFVFGFEIVKSTLGAGKSVYLKVSAFDWTPIANRYEVKVLIQKHELEPIQRLPEPLIINIEPLEFDHLQVLLPCTSKKGTLVTASITARDKFDNRVPYNGEITVTHNDVQGTLSMQDGLALFKAPFDSGNTESFRAAFGDKVYDSNPCVNSEELQLYVGDLHAHDFLSAAHGYSDKAYEWGRYDKNLDFVSVAVQNHGWTDNEKWAVAKHMNERYLEEGEFVTFLGCEWQHSGYGDKVVHFLGGDQPFLAADDRRSDSVEKFYETVRASDALVISHHTAYNQKLWCGGTDYDVIDTDIERLIELWSMHGSSEGYDENNKLMRDYDHGNTVKAALKKGLKLGFAAGSDTHSGRPGGSAKEPRPYWGGLTAVWAEAKTRRSIFEALYNRHTYALTGARIVLMMTVNGALMGSETESSEKADIKIKAWAPAIIEKLQILKNTELLTEISPGAKNITFSYLDKSKPGDFYHCRVVLEECSLAVSSPVWMI